MDKLTFFFEGDDFFSSLRQAIAQATESVEIELYYFSDDDVGLSFSELLKRKAKEGVKVRIIYDAVGCRGTSSKFLDALEKSGMRLKEYNPLLPPRRHFGRRDHRKIMIVDHRIGFLGGFNIASEYSRTSAGETAWRDSGICFEDPELIQKLVQLFEDSWEEKRLRIKDFIREKIPRPDWSRRKHHLLASHGWNRKGLIREEYLSAIIHAKRFIYITNSYFIPDRGIRRALRKASGRGVDVRLLVAGPTDVPIARWASQATYSSFLRAGVRIYEYQGRILHAKSAAIDTEWYTVGTSNMDPLSFFHNLEVNFLGRGPEEARLLMVQFAEDLNFSKELSLEIWRRRPWWTRLRERFFFFFRAWL